jgi:hypothetical protein
LISTDNIDRLIPEFLMDSNHFFLFVADIEGKVVKFNKGFERMKSTPVNCSFSDFLSPNSEQEFSYSLELMLGSPKIRRHLMLDHPALKSEGFSQIWWEFSVVTTQEMDVSGIIGIGVGMPFLEQEMPWNNLVDVLGFGEIILDQEFKVLSWDDRIMEWFEPVAENWKGKEISQSLLFRELNQFNHILSEISSGDRPICFLINTDYPGKPSFAALVTQSPKGFHLFLMPKAIPFYSKPEKPIIQSQMLGLFSGSVFVLNEAGKLIQQNEAAKNLGRVWKGRAYSEGFALNFPNQTNRFSKLLRAIEDAKKGQASELEIKLLMPNQVFSFWNVGVKPVFSDLEILEGVLIQIIDTTPIKSQLMGLSRENERLRELALSPSHILRGPLSSMMGILELMEIKKMDNENQKLFGYLKPLTKELDQVIRQHAKKISTFN